ncbi:adenylate kinase isoenzyme 1 [Lepeophtheirus salmonis]|uniref:Adenylate kinase 1 [Sorex araneus] n=1 Tax=Lepeophtheirus salmonis TaxID=72036 RepID=C1BVN8_LEPSM|nr:adenylate kinase isoenzyme 1-like [Lepeophtheirus salmonis]ACO13091.1 Adenylate kinase isoenzyme 1 [Lepeophtheirus salmonis]ADD24311.1 Adenylate kinase isoenzyme 1 [Lepeophtheirus salmonis]
MANVERKPIDTSCLKGIPIVWIMGGPGSGKGTQSEKVVRHFDYTHISSGDILRAEVMSNSNRGLQLYKLMANGDPVPNPIVNDLIAEVMVAKASSSKGFLVDGYPIEEKQAEDFENQIAPASLVLFLDCSDEILRDRLLKRGNFDDTEDAIKNRIETYNSRTKPILTKYINNVKKVNADQDKDQTYEDVKKIISELK